MAWRYAGRARLSVRLSQLASEGLFYLGDAGLFSSAFPLRRQLHWLAGTREGTAVDAAAARTGIAHVLGRRPYELSGGELRRAELAAILVRKPRCLVADEPYRGISPKDAAVLSSIFRELAAAGCAVVLSGHEVQTLFDVADRVTWCSAGTTYELGSASEARRHEQFRREYLGPRTSQGSSQRSRPGEGMGVVAHSLPPSRHGQMRTPAVTLAPETTDPDATLVAPNPALTDSRCAARKSHDASPGP